MNRVILSLAVLALLLGAIAARARLGDDTPRSLGRYGTAVASSGKPGELTSTRTFEASGLEVTLGYVAGIVEMITYTRTDRAFMPSEVEAILRTNGRKKTWIPGMGFGPGTYTCTNGAVATVNGEKIEIHTPVWTDAVAKDQATEKAAAAKAAAADPNAAPAADLNASPAASTKAP